jgi:succinate CoA transferase
MALKRMTAHEAAELINDGNNVGFSGFTHAGCPKAVPRALAERAEAEHAAGRPFKIGMFTGASTGDSIDGALARAQAVKFRTPYQTTGDMRNAINAGQVEYFDVHLSTLAQDLRYGFYGPVDVAVIEACDVTEDGQIVPTVGVGISPTLCKLAKTVIVELNGWHPRELRGMHDLTQVQDPPHRQDSGITGVRDRIGKDHIAVDPAKIVVVEVNEPNEGSGFAPVDEVTRKIGENVAAFFVAEMKAGRIPSSFLPIQSGVGNIANAVLAALADCPAIPDLEVYTEVIQDAVIDMLESGRVRFASGSSLTVSNPTMDRIYAKLPFFKERVLLRTTEFSNNPEIVRRLGIIAMNTALEADIFGNVNSTNVMGAKIMNGVGGSGDFTRAAYLSIFLTPSTAKGGKISAFVPMVSHTDHNEHDVKVVISEYGVADLRGKSPRQRAETIIENCVHPDYRPMLRRYLESGAKGHTPVNLETAFSFHKAFMATGDMHDAEL